MYHGGTVLRITETTESGIFGGRLNINSLRKQTANSVVSRGGRQRIGQRRQGRQTTSERTENPGSVSAGARREKQGAEYGYRAERAAPIFAAAGAEERRTGRAGKSQRRGRKHTLPPQGLGRAWGKGGAESIGDIGQDGKSRLGVCRSAAGKQGAEYGYRAERAAPVFAAAGGGGKENGTDGRKKQKSGEKTLRF